MPVKDKNQFATGTGTGQAAAPVTAPLFEATPPLATTVALDRLPDLLDCPPPSRDFVESVAGLGVIQPILLEMTDRGELIVLVGRRRIVAARLAGLTEIPAMVYNAGWVNGPRVTLTENAVRNSNFLAEIAAVERLRCKHLSDREICQATGLTMQRLSLVARVCNADPGLLVAYQAGKIAEGSLLTASKLPPVQQAELVALLGSRGETSRITAGDVKEAGRTKRSLATNSLPASLFEEEEAIPPPARSAWLPDALVSAVEAYHAIPPGVVGKAQGARALLGAARRLLEEALVAAGGTE